MALFFLSTMLSCDNIYTRTDYYFGKYQVYYKSHGACEAFIMQTIYEDENNIYYLTDGGCGSTDFYSIRYEKKYMNIPTAIEEGIISIDDVIDSEIPALLIEDKTEE